MSQIYVGCELEYATSCATTFLFQVNVSQTERQKLVSESLSLNRPNRAQGLELGLQHNRAQRCFVQSGSLVVHYEATVDLTAEVDFANDLVEQNYLEIPADALPYLNPSRYCESDLLGNFALSQFDATPHGLVRVRTICDWVFNNLTYVSDSTDSQTTRCRRCPICNVHWLSTAYIKESVGKLAARCRPTWATARSIRYLNSLGRRAACSIRVARP